jgi:hypothetical protein
MNTLIIADCAELIRSIPYWEGTWVYDIIPIDTLGRVLLQKA